MRPGELTAAALQLFAEKGFAATRLEDVAAAAGVSKGTVYLYFDSKEQLFEAVLREVALPNVDQAAALIDAFTGPTSSLLRRLIAMLEHNLDGPLPLVVKLVVAESNNFPALARLWSELFLAAALPLLQRVIRRGIDRGEFREVDPAAVAPLVFAPLFLLGLWRHSVGRHTKSQFDVHAILQTHLALLERGLTKAEAT